MSARKSPSGRDASLEELLLEAGLRITAEELRNLVRGVVAAPVGRDRDAWMALVAPVPTLAGMPELTA